MSLDPCSAVDIQKAVLFVSTGPKSLRHPNLVREAKEIWSINATTRDWSIPRSSLCSSAPPALVLAVDMTLVDPEIDHRLAVHWSSCNVGSDRPNCCCGRPVRLGFAGTIGREGG